MIVILVSLKVVWKLCLLLLDCDFIFRDIETIFFLPKIITNYVFSLGFFIADSFRKKPLAELISQMKLSDMGYFSLWFYMNSTWYTAVAPTALFQLSYLPVTKIPHILFLTSCNILYFITQNGS
jgi:hypothetical protein